MKKILIVDDQKEIRELLLMAIPEKKYEVMQAGNGKEAVEIARLNKPDIILMDVLMPELNGLEATKILKNDPETKECKIVILTAMDQKTDCKKGFEFEADAYVAKPFSPLALVKKIEEMLES
jgi:two-component system, OmpR family, phosphate regulon response regulator PhoB